MTSNKKKTIQLGMPHGTAQNRLRKMILFKLLQKTNLNICFQCGARIETIEELSIEHKVAWLDSKNPKGLFFDLGNIAFSHLKCNIGAAKKTTVWDIDKLKHPSQHTYDRGCRCSECRELKSVKNKKRIRSLQV